MRIMKDTMSMKRTRAVVVTLGKEFKTFRGSKLIDDVNKSREKAT